MRALHVWLPPAMKLLPVSVMVLLRYATLGNTLLFKVGDPKIVSAVPGDDITTDDGLLNLTSTPALPIAVPDPITTTTSVADEMLHVEVELELVVFPSALAALEVHTNLAAATAPEKKLLSQVLFPRVADVT
jgi:hypothetical protein